MTPDQWLDLITKGGATAVMVIVGWGMLRGDIRLGREVTARDERITELKDELRIAVDRFEKIVIEQAAISRQESAELRQTIESQRGTIERLASRQGSESAT